MSLGALTLLTGCDISDNDEVQKMFGYVSRWNSFVQAELSSGTKLAPEHPESMAVKNFRYNAWYHAPLAPMINASEYRLQPAGLIADKRPWTVQQLYALPQKSQVTRHVCVEGWSMIGKWTGTPLSIFLNRAGADTTPNMSALSARMVIMKASIRRRRCDRRRSWRFISPMKPCRPNTVDLKGPAMFRPCHPSEGPN